MRVCVCVSVLGAHKPIKQPDCFVREGARKLSELFRGLRRTSPEGTLSTLGHSHDIIGGYERASLDFTRRLQTIPTFLKGTEGATRPHKRRAETDTCAHTNTHTRTHTHRSNTPLCPQYELTGGSRSNQHGHPCLRLLGSWCGFCSCACARAYVRVFVRLLLRDFFSVCVAASMPPSGARWSYWWRGAALARVNPPLVCMVAGWALLSPVWSSWGPGVGGGSHLRPCVRACFALFCVSFVLARCSLMSGSRNVL